MSDFNHVVEIPYRFGVINQILGWFMSNNLKLFDDYDYHSTTKSEDNDVYIFRFHDKNVAVAFALVNME